MGRRRTFDITDALDAAVRVFWRKGYEGASYADLVRAMGIERPALYAAFGNKEALFRRALDRYAEAHMGHVAEALAMPTARAVAEHFLRGTVAVNTRHPEHRGCLGVVGGLTGTDEAGPVRHALASFRARGLELFRVRFEQAKEEGELPADADPVAMAAFLLTTAHGISVQAQGGLDPVILEAVVAQALGGWPQASRPRAG